MNEIATHARLDLIQLHGDEPADVPAQLCVPCLRVLHVPAGADKAGVLAQLDAHVGGPLALLLDTQVADARGGTGVVFDWALAAALSAAGVPSLVAGGLTGDNVASAVAASAPCWGIDASSGLETDGCKDAAKIGAYVAAAKAPLA
jgi:phosphoribosylanthranilate isomerase